MENEKPYTRRLLFFKQQQYEKLLFNHLNKLEKIQTTFLWKSSTPKIKHKALCNNYKAGGLKNVDIPKLQLFNAPRQEDFMIIFMKGS